jgi:hypothetical protein
MSPPWLRLRVYPTCVGGGSGRCKVGNSSAMFGPRAAEREGDVRGVHGVARRLRRRWGAGGVSPSEVDSRGALRRACAHFSASSHR